jgi:hypothetical protein
MEQRLITPEDEQELKQLFDSLEEIQIIAETTHVLTADEYDELTNFKWESYENEEQIGLFEG